MSGFTVGLAVTTLPSASTSVISRTDRTSGPWPMYLPCAFTESAPPTVKVLYVCMIFTARPARSSAS